MKRNILFFAAVAAAFSASAAEPAGYYTSCRGLSGQQLLKALESVISDHSEVGYGGLWTLYYTSDVDESGKIIDIYSTKRWTPGNEQCGTYSSVGDCYNREHSMPKSWFNDQYPMYDDAFHLYPTDGKVNGQRSNYPYGECANGTRLSASGGVTPLGKLGKSTFPGYSGTVFEPDDQYKGDLARSYFYMAACYNSRISSWNSDMLAGNTFPVFTGWALDLLLKWHREDPVSDKERKRNEAVAAAQHNRNPFIDHPEMAEHIWGNLSTTGWDSGAVTTPAAFTSPAKGSAIDMGTVAVGRAATSTVTVRGTGFTQNVTVSISGTGFSVSRATLTAAQVNTGTSVTVSLTAPSPGTCTGTLSLASGNVSTSATIRATALSGIPAGPAADVTSNGFTAVWVSTATDNDASYQLHVTDAEGSYITGYPVTVKATDERHVVAGLEPSTLYRYWLTYGTQKSNTVDVTTRGLLPELYLEPENDLAFRSEAGVPSEPVMVFIDAYNIDGDITVSVNAPFELSRTRKEWTQTITLTEDEGQFYIRLNGTTAGTYRTSITAIADKDCLNDNLVAEGVIESTEPMKESFEADVNFGYSGSARQGDAARWDFSGAGVFTDPREVRTGRQGVRFNASEGGYVMTTDGLPGGVASVTFHTRLWDNTPAKVTLDYSLDHGASWNTCATVTPQSDWTATTATINVNGEVKLRFSKPEGARVALDDIEITPLLSDITPGERNLSWNATAVPEGIAVTNLTGEMQRLAVYDLDGCCIWNAVMPAGTVILGAPRGHYIAVSGNESRRIVVR